MRLEYLQNIDKIVELDLRNRTVRAEADIPEQSPIFEGHFPGHPLMPGVLLAETMAQASGWLIIGCMKFERMPFLAAVKEAKFRTFVTPGTKLDVHAKIIHDGSGYAVTKAAIKVDGKQICDAELTLRVMPFPDPKFREQMEATARRIGFPMEALADG